MGMPLVSYDITPYDHSRFLEGITRLAELHFAMGAEEVMLPFTNLHRLESPDALTMIRKTQSHRKTMELFTPHLMGTAKMGSRSEDSVVDPNGQLWGLPGCYVADASLFPTAIGVNPQLTIMALATHVAERLSRRLQGTRLAA